MMLDGKDIGILVGLWQEGARMIELEGNHQENKRRVYRMSKARLCGCSRQDTCSRIGRNEPIWGITPQGIQAIELSEANYSSEWRELNWSMDFKIKDT